MSKPDFSYKYHYSVIIINFRHQAIQKITNIYYNQTMHRRFTLTFTFSWATRRIGFWTFELHCISFFSLSLSLHYDWQEGWTMHHFFLTFTFSTTWLTRGMDIGSRCVPSAAIVQTERHWSDLRIDDHHSLTSTQASQCWSFQRKSHNSALNFGLTKMPKWTNHFSAWCLVLMRK